MMSTCSRDIVKCAAFHFVLQKAVHVALGILPPLHPFVRQMTEVFVRSILLYIPKSTVLKLVAEIKLCVPDYQINLEYITKVFEIFFFNSVMSCKSLLQAIILHEALKVTFVTFVLVFRILESSVFLISYYFLM